MALTPSQRPTRELPLLVLALAIVGAICIPLWGALADPDSGGTMWSNWDSERWARLLFGPEQIACYCCFTWAGFILLSRYLEVRRQRTAFGLGLLPTEEGARILHEDARPLQRRVEQATERRGPFILSNMIRLALTKFAASHSSQEVTDTVRTQAEVEQGRLATSMATVHYLAWAIPAIGFLGTVRGLAGSLTMTGSDEEDTMRFIQEATRHLNVAFDCTLIALVFSLAVMFLIHNVQRDEDALVIDCQQYCLEHLVNRIYEPEPVADGPGASAQYPAHEPGGRPLALGGRGSRLSS
jgi:biopolymer transport protein ExbB/TolQ